MTGELIDLRPLEVSDEDFLQKMAYEALGGNFKDLPPFGEPVVMEAITENTGGWGKDSDKGFIAFDPDGVAAGAAWRRVFPDRYKELVGRSFTPVVTMAVVEEFRGHGYGKALLRRLMDDSAALNIPRLNLSVAEHNKVARGLYHTVGFKEVTVHRSYFNSMSVPAVKMSVRLDG